MAYLAYKKTGLRLCGALIAYNCIGAFDYANGLLTVYLSPQVSNPPEIWCFVGCSVVKIPACV